MLINKAHCKQRALEFADCRAQGNGGAKRFTRVSAEFLERIDRRLEQLIHDEVFNHPVKGVTLR